MDKATEYANRMRREASERRNSPDPEVRELQRKADEAWARTATRQRF